MPASVSEATTEITNMADLLNQVELFASTNSENVVALEQAIIDNLRGSAAAAVLSAARSPSSALRPLLEPAAVRAAFTGPLQNMMEAIDVPDRGFARNMVAWRDYLRDQSDSVNSRGFTYGSLSAGGGNVGNGVPLRLNVDDAGQPLEGAFAEARELLCIRDQGAVNEFEEVFRFEGANRGLGWLDVAGSGIDRELRCFHGNDAASFLVNPSFSVFNGTAPSSGSPATPSATTDVTGWVLSSASDFRVDVDTVYRGFPGDTLPKSLRFMDNGNISQVLKDNANPALSLSLPYVLQVAVYRESSCDGNLTLDLGASSQTFAMSSLTNSAWNVVKMDLDSDLYYTNFKEADLDIKFTLASRTTGTLYLDDVLFGPMTMVDGLWYFLPGGSTSFLEGDVFTWTDSEAGTRAILQYWLSFRTQLSQTLGYGFSLPSDNGGTETISDP